jgi:hypothetical protein
MIQFNQLTIPTPEPYDRSASTKQQENFYYVLNQIMAQLKINNETKTLNLDLTTLINTIANLHLTANMSVDLTDLTNAVKDLAFNGQAINLSGLLPGLHVKLEFTGRGDDLSLSYQ